MVDLCRRLTRSGTVSNVTLIYVHRGHHCPCKTPLLQTLLAELNPRLHVFGLRVEQERLPLDTVLLGVASLEICDRCVIIKDNAVRLGTADVTSMHTNRYLVLSRSSGPWAIDSIVIEDEDPAFLARRAMPFLDDFSTDAHCGTEFLSLATQMTNGHTGIINIAKRTASNALAEGPRTRTHSKSSGSGVAGVGGASTSVGWIAIEAES
jgi:hypothetical protein